MFGSRKDEGLSPVVRLDEFYQGVGLTGPLKRDEVLLHGLGRRVLGAHGNLGRVVDQSLCELADVIREGRGEHEVLAFAGKLGDRYVGSGNSNPGNSTYWAGPLDDEGRPPEACSVYDRLYDVKRANIDTFLAGGEPTTDLEEWPTGLGAPTIDAIRP